MTDCDHCSPRHVPCGVGVCGQQDNNCDLCGIDSAFTYHECQNEGCDYITCLDCTEVCDKCGRRFCINCWKTWTKDKTKAGISVNGRNICYECIEEPDNEQKIQSVG